MQACKQTEILHFAKLSILCTDALLTLQSGIAPRSADRAMAASSTRSLAVGQRLHHLKVFFSNRFVYAQVTRTTDGHVRALVTH